MQTFIIIALLLGGASYFFLTQAVFGKLPSGARLKRIQQSENESVK